MKATYRAKQETDGTYTIRGVPVFCEVAEGVKGAPADIGRDWMERAVDAAAKLEKENGYLPPLNYGHHKAEGGEPVRKIGHFRLSGVKAMHFEDKEQCVLLADFVKIPKEEFERFRNGEYPYRSVEINDWNEPRINHLSVLAHQEPHFKLPMTTGDTIKLDESTVVSQMSAFEGKKLAILFCEAPEGIKMAKPAIEPEKASRLFLALFEAGKVDGEGNLLSATPPATTDDEPTEAEFADFARKAITLAGDEIETDASEADLAKFGRELLADMNDDGPDDDPTPAELDGKTAAKLAVIADKAERAEHAVVTFQAEQKAEKETAARLAKAEADLKGYNLGTKTRTALAESAKTGGAQFDAFVAAVKESAPREPVTLAAETVVADPVLNGLNVRPEDAEDAVRFASEYDVLEKRGLVRGISKKDHILSQFQSRGARASFAASAAGN